MRVGYGVPLEFSFDGRPVGGSGDQQDVLALRELSSPVPAHARFRSTAGLTGISGKQSSHARFWCSGSRLGGDPCARRSQVLKTAILEFLGNAHARQNLCRPRLLVFLEDFKPSLGVQPAVIADAQAVLIMQ